MSSSPIAAMPGFPFGLAADGAQLNSVTANAIDAHLMEIAAIRNTVKLDSQGTVLAVVTFPKDDGLSRACDGSSWQDVRLRMNYDKLTALGSRKIQDMLSPKAQARFRRRLGFQQQLPPGVEYVLDFTPPTEGPELADLTAALWLPRIVKLWFLAGHYVPDPILETGMGYPTRPLADKAVGAIMALGHDDICKNLGCLADYSEWKTKDNVPGIVEDPPSGPAHIPTWRKVEDYCPIRHRVAIVRILKAINGEGLLLNSAVRVWTIAQVAISLEIPQVVVDPVTQWLVAPPNTKFIELCPEKAFQLAYALKIPSVLIAAFRILVNELAIDYASSNPTPGRPPLTWAGRRRDDYGDYPSDPVEYASREFAERMNGKLQLLRSDDVFSRLPRPNLEWDKLCYLGSLIMSLGPSHPLRKAYYNLTTSLIFAFRKWHQKALNLDEFSPRMRDLVDAQRAHYIPAYEREPLIKYYKKLNAAQKVLTPFFWNRLNLTEPRADFAATFHRGIPLSSAEITFNAALRRAIAEQAIVPSLAHPSLAILNITDLASRDIEFNLAEFHRLLVAGVTELCAQMLVAHHAPFGMRDGPESGIPFFLSDHLLLCLEESELNYLPIWADGLDDGSGGVFQQMIPEAEMGPSEPGPGYHTGYTAAGTTDGVPTEMADDNDDGDRMTVVTGGYAPSTVAPSDLGLGALSLGTATAARSLAVQLSGAGTTTSTSTGMSGATPRSEAFTEDEGMYADARFAQPAAHQAQGVAIEGYVDEAEVEHEDGQQEGGDDGMDLDFSDEEIDFGSDDDDGSSTLDGFEEVDADEAS